MSDAWGIFGRPPASVMNGTHPEMEWFKKYHEDLKKLNRLKPGPNKTKQLEELRQKYIARFPSED